MTFVIAIDGPAASGKGTLARNLAVHYGFAYLDTGRLYRAVAHALMQSGLSLEDEAAAAAAARALDFETLDDAALRRDEVGTAASRVAAIGPVREALRDRQRAFAAAPPGGEAGAVIDGRDIGTVICPDADVKLFVTASPEARAHRRWLELRAGDPGIAEAAVLADIEARDRRDTERAHSPLKPAVDAHLLDTTEMSIETAFNAAVQLIERERN